MKGNNEKHKKEERYNRKPTKTQYQSYQTQHTKRKIERRNLASWSLYQKTLEEPQHRCLIEAKF